MVAIGAFGAIYTTIPKIPGGKSPTHPIDCFGEPKQHR